MNLTEKSRNRSAVKDALIRKNAEKILLKLKKNSNNISGVSPTASPSSTSKKPTSNNINNIETWGWSEYVTAFESTTVSECCQIMAAKKTDALIVIFDESQSNSLAGIVTDKDIAIKVVNAGLDPSSTLISEIMTRNPFCLASHDDLSEALTIMSAKRFRHLPIVSSRDHNEVVGILDVTKVLIQALTRAEKAEDAAKGLEIAMRNLLHQEHEQLSTLESMITKLASPSVCSLLYGVNDPSYLKTSDFLQRLPILFATDSVFDAAKLMKEKATTAVLVVASDKLLKGIFTSKDLVLRVLAAGLNPKLTSLVRVMTPHPDTIAPSVTIVDALRKMHDGHYLHLPVTMNLVPGDCNCSIFGIVDVLQLTLATVELLDNGKGKHSITSVESFQSNSENESFIISDEILSNSSLYSSSSSSSYKVKIRLSSSSSNSITFYINAPFSFKDLQTEISCHINTNEYNIFWVDSEGDKIELKSDKDVSMMLTNCLSHAILVVVKNYKCPFDSMEKLSLNSEECDSVIKRNNHILKYGYASGLVLSLIGCVVMWKRLHK